MVMSMIYNKNIIMNKWRKFNVLNLEPQSGSQKSFYGKARIFVDKDENDNTCSYLVSYDTIVGKYNHDKNDIKFFGYWSQTTGKHQSAFAEYYGFDPMGKKEILNNC